MSKTMPVPLITELTPPGAGGVSVLSLRGPGTEDLLRAWGCAGGPPGQLRFCQLTIEGEVLDEAMVCVFSSESAEVHVHGSRPLVRRLCAKSNASSGPAESASISVRAQRALGRASCELAARIVLDQVEGAWDREVARLLACADDPLLQGIAAWNSRSQTLRWAFDPARVLIAGPVNAGKSTLFNALVGAERAIISEVEGTTRDLVCERVQLGAWPVDLVDSAGQRDLAGSARDDEVERAGQNLARREADRSDWILWLVPGPTSAAKPFGEIRTAGRPVTELATCSDRLGADPRGISALRAPAEAADRVAQLFRRALALPDDPWVPGEALAFDGRSRDFLAKLTTLPPDLIRELLSNPQETGPRHC